MELQEMGHPQPPMIVITDNSTAEGIVNNCDCVKQGHYLVIWKPGEDNLADYSTKLFCHPPAEEALETY
eukprot:15359809-Ditylum_brightwellii.AAC.1